MNEEQYRVLVDELPGDKNAILALLGRGEAAEAEETGTSREAGASAPAFSVALQAQEQLPL